MAPLSAAFAELSGQLGIRQNLLENTVESIRDCVVVADENAVVVVANAAARRLLGVDRGFDSLTGVRKFACFLSDGTTPLPIPDSPLARALRGENVDDFELVVQEHPAKRSSEWSRFAQKARQNKSGRSSPTPGRCATNAAGFAGR